MRFDIVTIFPEMFEGVLSASILGKARGRGLIDVHLHDVRNFTADRHRTVDDAPYGGGAGMVMQAPPLVAAIEAVPAIGRRLRILLTPAGEPLTQAIAAQLATCDQLVLVCGRYEGVDERVAELAIDQQISIGDVVVSGGELPAMLLIDAVARLVPGVLGNEESAQADSFSKGLLEYPHYTRPPVFRGLAVPEVLLSGDHAAIVRWRRERSLERTSKQRPDLLSHAELTNEEKEWLRDRQKKGRIDKR